MKHRTLRTVLTLAFSVLAFSVNPNNAQEASLPRATPQSQGVRAEGILAFLQDADASVDSMHSFMLLRNGAVVSQAWWSPESADQPHVLWSLSKSFTSTAVGLAVSEGRMSVDDLVIDHFPQEAPESPSQNLKRMRVRDLLTMSTGHQDEPNVRESDTWAKTFLSHPVPHKPGTHFKYNTPATYMLSSIVQRVTGDKVVDYLQPRLFDPLGIEPPRWDDSPEGVSLGGYGLYLKTEDIAKFGQLYLQNGVWHGKQLIPEDWIANATKKQVSNGSSPDSDWDQGYCFQFWRCRHGAFRGDGKDGQFCVVMPDQNAVIVITANTRDLQGVLNLVWKHLLPAMQDSVLPEDDQVNQKITRFASQLKATR